ncbi:putative transcription factor C2C2-GATA family [Medicago truncatula]|uniref:GATA type zinc finger transcription factor family protein n=1 Tax=Medicago truncatula TaxID=3880 RepID=G7KWI0_MEDTR|nr:GATA transcription factor 16 [Medicago truncatula]AES82392.1 GATA type zinc finger transcription factor family protein [Medicago truncatula]RHN49189.1 putative transcription factor C2C2-GATA family [Medicago truncatula]
MGIMDQMDKECCSYDEMGVIKKFCADCKTTKTPLWRGGPNGPKTLCNACGIRYRKRRGCCSKGQERERKREKAEATSSDNDDLSECLKMKLVALGEEFLLQKKQRMIKLGEEEQAAVCLMALSCGFVFA